MLTRTQSVEPAVFSSTNSLQSNLSGFNALLKSKSKLQDEFFKSQREVSNNPKNSPRCQVQKREGELKKQLALQTQQIA